MRDPVERPVSRPERLLWLLVLMLPERRLATPPGSDPGSVPITAGWTADFTLFPQGPLSHPPARASSFRRTDSPGGTGRTGVGNLHLRRLDCAWSREPELRLRSGASRLPKPASEVCTPVVGRHSRFGERTSGRTPFHSGFPPDPSSSRWGNPFELPLFALRRDAAPSPLRALVSAPRTEARGLDPLGSGS